MNEHLDFNGMKGKVERMEGSQEENLDIMCKGRGSIRRHI